MWKLEIPDDRPAIDELRTALTPMRGGEAVALSEADVISFTALYALYDERLGEPSADLVGEQIGTELAQAVHDGYDSTIGNGRLSRLRDRLQVNVQRCPLCGFAPVTTLDHHLPRSAFKALSVYARNLVPVCGTCNQKKGAGVGGNGQNQRFINAYFLNAPNERFFLADCTMNAGALNVTFRIVQVAQLPNDTFERLCYQFERLNLNERLKPEVNELLLSMKPALQAFFLMPDGAAAVRSFLELSARSHEETHGMNHWKTALFGGLARSNEFCEEWFRIGRPQAGA